MSAGMGGERIDRSTVVAKGSYEVALLAAGGVIAVLDGRVDNAFALVRPPGHHALPDAAMGFCLFGNAAIAVHHAREARGLDRVAIADWDVHHANGTQAAFYEDSSVLTISLHQDSCFPPGSGRIEENGEGAGRGYNLNVPLPPGEGGYSAELVPFCGLAIVEELSGIRTDVRGTILQEFTAGMGQQELEPHQRRSSRAWPSWSRR